MCTILEVLQNAEINLGVNTAGFQNTLGRNQLKNAIILLEKGKDVNEEYNEEDLI